MEHTFRIKTNIKTAKICTLTKGHLNCLQALPLIFSGLNNRKLCMHSLNISKLCMWWSNIMWVLYNTSVNNSRYTVLQWVSSCRQLSQCGWVKVADGAFCCKMEHTASHWLCEKNTSSVLWIYMRIITNYCSPPKYRLHNMQHAYCTVTSCIS